MLFLPVWKQPAKKILCLCAVLFSVTACLSQDIFPEYGSFSNYERTLRRCEFDTDAVAIVLMDEAVSNYDDENQLITDRHVRIKILKEKGFSAANITIPYYSNNGFEFISGLEGMVFNNGESGEGFKSKLGTGSVYTVELTKRVSALKFTFPDIRIGSIIDYKYRSTMKSYGGLDDWNFQQEYPVVTSRYMLNILPNTEFSYLVNKNADLDIIIKPEQGAGRVYFEMNNIPGLNDEPYMDARRDYLQKVTFQLSSYRTIFSGRRSYMNNWQEVNLELLGTTEFGSQIDKNISKAQDVVKAARLLEVPEKIMCSIHDYVRHNFNWNGIYSKYAMEGVKKVWDLRNGTSGEINLMLVNLLRDAGLDAYPLLVSERFNGKVSPEFPFVDQFNSVFAAVVINGKYYYLDGTDKFTPAQLVPFDILNTNALLVKRKGGGIIQIKNEELKFSEQVNSYINVDENGKASGNVVVKSADYARVKKMEAISSDRTAFKNKYFSGEGLSGVELKLTNEENDSLELIQECNFNMDLRGTGGYRYIPLDLFSGFAGNPFISNTRFSNVNFGYRRNINLHCEIKLPSAFSVDEVPKDIILKTPEGDVVFKRIINVNKEDRYIVSNIEVDFKKSLYSTDEYPVLKAFYKKMFDLFKEPLLLKTK